MLRYRSLAVWVHLLMVLLATVNSSLGCEHCLHQLTQSSQESSVSSDGGQTNPSQENTGHACVCSCLHACPAPQAMHYGLLAISPANASSPGSYTPFELSPPLHPPRA